MYALDCIMHRSPPHHQFFYLLKYFEIHSQFYSHLFLAPSWTHNYWTRYLSHFSKLNFIENTYSILEPSRKSYLDFHEQNNSVLFFCLFYFVFLLLFLRTLQTMRVIVATHLSLRSHVLENFAYCTKGEVTLIFLHWQWLAIF